MLNLVRSYDVLVVLLFGSCFLFNLTVQRSHHNFDSQESAEETNDGSVAEEFDYLILREIWPESSCMFPGENTCTIGKNVTTWVVHGLWPTIENTKGPNYCNDSYPFDFDSIKPLLPQLLEYWPNLYTNTALDSFWEHEWTKHGTCALSLPQVRNEKDYFNVSLSLRNKYDFGKILEANSIVPDDTQLYDLTKIKDALRSVLNVEPSLVCYIVKDSDVQYLSQMQICLSKKFELMDCSEASVKMSLITRESKTEETTCQEGLPVHYPTIQY